MSKRTRQLFSALTASAFLCASILPGCSGSESSTTQSPGGGAGLGGMGGSAGLNSNGGASGLGRGGGSAGTVSALGGAAGMSSGGALADAGSDGLSECDGTTPYCRGTNLQDCCGNDPYGPATCQNGRWMCSLFGSTPVPAPGCHLCGLLGEGGAGGDTGQAGAAGQSATACTGQAPLCFGSNLQTCCGNDPAGTATCQNGAWQCFGVPAPGCNGQHCF